MQSTLHTEKLLGYAAYTEDQISSGGHITD